MSGSKKRSFSDMLAGSNTPAPVPTFTVPRINAGTTKWSTLSNTVASNRSTITSHRYKVAGTTKHGTVELSHTHGEFNKIVPSSGSLGTHNISTSELGSSARSFPKILGDLSTKKGATDALRVLKGTHLSKGLIGSTAAKRQAAVELGAEIGISEYTRGSTVALADASINLYRMKHGKLSKSEFTDHNTGYTGAGKGGAERLRSVKSIEAAFEPYDGALKGLYTAHASKKLTRPWETTLGPKATGQEKYDAWRYHKFKKWTGRE